MQTGPVSYTIQTADGRIWRRHVDQLLQTAATAFMPFPEAGVGDSVEGHTSDSILAPGGTSVPNMPVPDPPPEMPVALAPPSPAGMSSSPKDSIASSLGELRYPEREQRPPKRMDL